MELVKYRVIDRATGKPTKEGCIRLKRRFGEDNRDFYSMAESTVLKAEGLTHPWDVMIDLPF